jgi:hypothetical protein
LARILKFLKAGMIIAFSRSPPHDSTDLALNHNPLPP